MDDPKVSLDDVLCAATRLKGKVLRTPLLESLALNNLTGARILVKAECLQTAGSFKIRGALHRVLRLSDAQRTKGVIAFSSGNFGQGLALYTVTNQHISIAKFVGNIKNRNARRQEGSIMEHCLQVGLHQPKRDHRWRMAMDY